MEAAVKIGIIGTGNVGCACAMAAVNRGSAREIVLVNRSRKTAEAVATDMLYGTPLGPKVDIVDGDYGDLKGAGIVLITVGVNEKTGGATDRNDPLGRLKLLDKNAGIYRDIVPRIVRAEPNAVLLVVSDPPDPLADVARPGVSRRGGVEHRHISRQPAISRSPRQAFRCGSRACRSTGDWRPRDLARVPVVLGTRRRSASGGIARAARRADRRTAAHGGARGALRQHQHHRGARCQPIRYRHRIGPHRRDGAQ